MASLTRESDGGGAPIFTPEFPKADPYPRERGAVGDAGARELAGRMERKHFVIIGRDAALSVSQISGATAPSLGCGAPSAGESDGGGAPSLPSERRAFGDAGAGSLRSESRS